MPLGAPEELQWSHTANCYGYAFDCQNPTNGANGTATPGAVNGNAALPFALGNYDQALIAGTLADGGGQVAQVAGTPAIPPADTPGKYVVALLANQYGFHWIRRDGHLNRWSWKDGNGGTVKYNVLHTGNSHYVYVKNETLGNFLASPAGSYGGWIYTPPAWHFVSYFSVSNGGFQVAAP